MNYENIYNQLIERAKTRTLECYKERHHIVPRCQGGTDDKDNLVDLTAREHFIAHWLLSKMYPNHSGLQLAFAAMTSFKGHTHQRYQCSSVVYEIARLKASKAISNMLVGNKNRVGRSHSAESKAKLSKALKGRTYSTETINKIKTTMMGRKLPQSTIDKMKATKLLRYGPNKVYVKKTPEQLLESKRNGAIKLSERNKGPQWEHYDELFNHWKDNGRLSYHKFRQYAVANGYPDTSYQTMVKTFVQSV
ncbi:HNH endonuclease signature motif containing protein [Enterobacter rongchengensis]|uniref:HNH endonuclease signature motif containing protein n=1 Tax=Enterobacter rongchengensis TaxID=3030999 RepID=A0ABV4JCZ5_9ENTR